MVTEVADQVNVADSPDVVTVNDAPDLVSVVDAPDGMVVVTDATDNYTLTDAVDSVNINDSVDSYEVIDAPIVNNITVVKPVAIHRAEPVAGEDIGVYKMVAISSGNAVLADHTNPAHSRSTLGINDTFTTTGNQTSVIVVGEIVNVGWSFTVDDPVFLSTTGDLTQTIPTTGFLLKIGIALASDKVLIDIQMPIHLH